MWYGIGNTSMPNPSTMEMGITRDGVVRFFSGAVDIGQGSNTVMAQSPPMRWACRSAWSIWSPATPT
jgi:CO/xanthine dehydrogenase Mo-binding subunit